MMKIIIESTAEIVEIQADDYTAPIRARVWEGQTDSGIKVSCLIPRIAAHKDQDLSQFEKELQEQSAPSAWPRVFPLRMII
jgi:hypothetical protein